RESTQSVGPAVVVDRASAAEWLAQRLAEPVDDGVLTVVWQSVTRLYWPPEEIAAVAAVVEEARARGSRVSGQRPVVHLALEHPWASGGTPGRGHDGLPRLEVDGEPIAVCDHHGPPVRLLR
ncbi:MAG: DUF2332 family protein, partial [Dermatophilaceae bacterium]